MSVGTLDESAVSNAKKSPIIFYTSRITPSCRAVRMLATHLNIELREQSLRCYIDTRTEKFRKFPGEYSASRGKKMVAVTHALTLLEIFLINKNYVACDHLTIADLSILASVTLLEIAVEFDLTSYPNIWHWYNRLRNELPYYNPLTKVAHDELRALIRGIRDAHEEWSSPLPQCAFVPNDQDADCAEEERRQYQRLFLNANDQQDAARIMAAVSPVFRKSAYSQQQQQKKQQTISNISIESSEIDNLESENNIKDERNGKISRKLNNQSAPLVKRIRLTIEPNTGQTLQLSHLDSPSLSDPNSLLCLNQNPFSLYGNQNIDYIRMGENGNRDPMCSTLSDQCCIPNSYNHCTENFCHNC
ncbi:hypothetical protein RDWZM_005339 [Blomia tropicalis]|uniref:GST C-terminal domain-containing protein n=1 Tax=Blomia tropicalis TaxID=40697 RepID=A0A9Q0M8B6_BLOTA|nr:hypothetical protein RDWZM_005339 [Blomia tropicalis]